MPLFKLELDTKKAQAGFVNIEKAVGIASRNTLNIMAALTSRGYKKNAKDNLTLRNTFTTRNIKFEKTQYIKMKRQVTKAGATERADYMELQDKGGLRKTRSGRNLAIPQKGSRGGSNKRVVSRQSYLRKISRRTVRWPKGKGTKSSRTVAVAAVAKKKNLFMNYGKNIYQITSFNKINGRIRFTKRHLYNTSQKSTRVRRQPMLEPATKKPIRDAQNIFNSQLNKQLRSKKIV